MPYRKEQFISGDIYHVIIRAIDENTIFKDIDDYYRGIFSIYEFNDAKPVVIRDRRKVRSHTKRILRKMNKNPNLAPDSRDKLVGILAFCFMPNHLHLLIKQSRDGGITKFMSKLGIGYGKYFNTKYMRKGYVFQNRFKAVRIKSDEQLKIAWAYINANPVSLVEPKWKERGILNFKKVIQFLKSYKWSSYSDYLGRDNFPSVTERNFILEIIGSQKKCEDFLDSYLKYRGRGKVKEFPELALE